MNEKRPTNADRTTDEIVWVGSSRKRQKDRLVKIIKKKQTNTMRWANKFYAHRKRAEKRLERELAKQQAKFDRQVAKLKAGMSESRKVFALYKARMSSDLAQFREKNASIYPRALKFDAIQHFYTSELVTKSTKLIKTEHFIRYLVNMEEKLVSGEIERYDLFLLLVCSEAEYITRANLEARFGAKLTVEVMNRVNHLTKKCLLTKANKKPIRLAITDLGRKRIKEIINQVQNIKMKNYI